MCSHDAKSMLLKHEVYRERMLKDGEFKGEERDSRTFGHLKVGPSVLGNNVSYVNVRDLLVRSSLFPSNYFSYSFQRDLDIETPTIFEFSTTETVTVTLFEANHCPGSVMWAIHISTA